MHCQFLYLLRRYEIKTERQSLFTFLWIPYTKRTLLWPKYLVVSKLYVPLHRLMKWPCPDGGIGRRAGLKHQWSNPSRFDPGSGYKGKAERMIIHCLAFPFLLTSSLNQIDAYFVGLLSLKWKRCWVISMCLEGCSLRFWLMNCEELGFIIIWSWRRWNCFQNETINRLCKGNTRTTT